MYSGNSYKKFPELYDLLYQRYLKSVPDFIALVESNTPSRGKILDIAAGTGEVSIPLLKNGFTVTSVDLNKGMLKELKLKAEKSGVRNYRTIPLDMRKLSYKREFDSVCMRQAVNYFIGIKNLKTGFKNICDALKSGGRFIFNAPDYRGEKKYPTVSNFYQKGTQNAFVLEMNKMNRKILNHIQHSIIWENDKEPISVTDKNSFYMFTKKEFENALKNSGFSKMEWSGSKKTLYCVAIK